VLMVRTDEAAAEADLTGDRPSAVTVATIKRSMPCSLWQSAPAPTQRSSVMMPRR
jgi:hypothetical protein